MRDLAESTGLSYATAYKLYRGRTKMIARGNMDKLFRHFGVGVGEILERVEEE